MQLHISSFKTFIAIYQSFYSIFLLFTHYYYLKFFIYFYFNYQIMLKSYLYYRIILSKKSSYIFIVRGGFLLQKLTINYNSNSASMEIAEFLNRSNNKPLLFVLVLINVLEIVLSPSSFWHIA